MADDGLTIEKNDSAAAMQTILEKQRKAYLAEGAVTAATRTDRVNRVIDLLVQSADLFCDAMDADFGGRGHDMSMALDFAGTIDQLKYDRGLIKRMMKPSKRRSAPPLGLLGGRSWIEYQPLGVVGNMSPWNFPVNLSFGPMGSIFGAGNRCMLKPSEFTPATSEVMAEVVPKFFDEDELAIVLGGVEAGVAFSKLAFDHLLFTGAPSVAKHVMRAAAENLVPVTLELGGKSPVIVGRTADMEKVAKKVMFGKMLNAGQICLAPDYIAVPEGEVDNFTEAAVRAGETMYPDMKDNGNYISVINDRNRERLMGYVEDARAKGAKVIEINPGKEDFSQQRGHKMPTYLIVDPTEDMKVLQDEIFGPILPIKTYRDVQEIIDYVNDRPRPLALYYFGSDAAEQKQVFTRTTSGGAVVNDVIMHIMQHDMPFGGVGNSGIGAYHGPEGFRTFQHAKSIYKQSPIDIGKLLRPPLSDLAKKVVAGKIKN